MLRRRGGDDDAHKNADRDRDGVADRHEDRDRDGVADRDERGTGAVATGRRTERTEVVERDRAATWQARAKFSPWAILTGVVVALGSFFLLSFIIAGIAAATGLADEQVTTSEAIDASVSVGIALVVTQFLAYLWGGYTAGRMGRGKGALHGILVPITAVLLAVLATAIAVAFGTSGDYTLPYEATRLPQTDYAIDWGTTVAIAVGIAMLLGGLLGGMLGSRWHTKLERKRLGEWDERESTTPRGGVTHDRTVHLDNNGKSTPTEHRVGSGTTRTTDR